MFWIFHLGGGSISLELILLPKRFLGPTNFWSNKIVGPITFCVEKKIYSKEYWVKKTLVRKNFRSTKVFGPTKFLVQQNYGSNKLSGPTKLSKPQLNHNSTQPNITLSRVRHDNDFAPPTPHPPQKLNVSNFSAVPDPILMKH